MKITLVPLWLAFLFVEACDAWTSPPSPVEARRVNRRGMFTTMLVEKSNEEGNDKIRQKIISPNDISSLFGGGTKSTKNDKDFDDEDEDDEDVGVLEGDQTMVEGDITKPFQTLIVSLIVGWIESVQIPMDSQLNRAIVNQAIPSQADETYDFILNVVNTLRLYYPRYETLKTEKEVIKSQLIPFLTLCNWSFQKMNYHI